MLQSHENEKLFQVAEAVELVVCIGWYPDRLKAPAPDLVAPAVYVTDDLFAKVAVEVGHEGCQLLGCVDRDQHMIMIGEHD